MGPVNRMSFGWLAQWGKKNLGYCYVPQVWFYIQTGICRVKAMGETHMLGNVGAFHTCKFTYNIYEGRACYGKGPFSRRCMGSGEGVIPI